MQIRLALLAFLMTAIPTVARPQTSCLNAVRPEECEVRTGVEEYKLAHYEQAISHFRAALRQDPKLIRARLYLATALAQEYVPGIETADATQPARDAIEEFSEVLKQDGADADERHAALRGIAALLFNMKKFDEAKSYLHQALEVHPDDAEAAYSIGVIDWTVSYQARMLIRSELKLKPAESLPNGPVCRRFANEYKADVEDGINSLNRAIQLRPDYDDAMAYMNLLYRERAETHCSDPAARTADTEKANKWVDVTIATKKAKETAQPRN